MAHSAATRDIEAFRQRLASRRLQDRLRHLRYYPQETPQQRLERGLALCLAARRRPRG